MPIAGARRRFTTWQISGAPAESGVYALWDGDEAIYIGAARGGEVTIRSRLQDHYTRRSKPHDATHFSFEPAREAARREAELLEQFFAGHQRLPRWNQGGRG
jgi:hypothetical protein